MIVLVAVNGQLQSEIVATQSGRIRGYVADPSVQTLQFLGIPYAKPPIGMSLIQFNCDFEFCSDSNGRMPVVKHWFQPSSHECGYNMVLHNHHSTTCQHDDLAAIIWTFCNDNVVPIIFSFLLMYHFVNL